MVDVLVLDVVIFDMSVFELLLGFMFGFINGVYYVIIVLVFVGGLFVFFKMEFISMMLLDGGMVIDMFMVWVIKGDLVSDVLVILVNIFCEFGWDVHC